MYVSFKDFWSHACGEQVLKMVLFTGHIKKMELQDWWACVYKTVSTWYYI